MPVDDTRNDLLSDILNSNPTSFLEGRDFRAFKELGIANGESLVLEVIVPVDIYLNRIILDIDSGHARYSALAGGTGVGVPVVLPTIFPANQRSDVKPYTRQVSVNIIDSVTGGTELDVARVKTGTNNQAVSIIDSSQDKRGYPAGTYHLIIENIGTGSVEGVFYAQWAEWP